MGACTWLSQLSICLWLRSRSQDAGTQPYMGSLLSGESASSSAPPALYALSLSQINKCNLEKKKIVQNKAQEVDEEQGHGHVGYRELLRRVS